MNKFIIFLIVILVGISLTLAWYYVQKVIYTSKYKNEQFLNEIDEQGEYIIKRVTKNELEFPATNNDSITSVYIEHNGKFVWCYTISYYTKVPNESNWTRQEWIKYDLKGNRLDSVENIEDLPTNGHFVAHEIDGHEHEFKNPNAILYVKSFQYDKFNWEMLNPLSGIGNPTGGNGSGGYWEGLAHTVLNLSNGQIKFKVRTDKTSFGYDFRPIIFKPTNELFIMTMQNRIYPKNDIGIYFIYKK